MNKTARKTLFVTMATLVLGLGQLHATETENHATRILPAPGKMLIDGKVVASATGRNHNHMFRTAFNVRQFEGKLERLPFSLVCRASK